MVQVSTPLSEVMFRKDKDELFVRFPFGEIERDKSFDILADKFSVYQRENDEADLGTVKLEFTEEEGVWCHYTNSQGFSKEVPISEKALVGLFGKFNLSGITALLSHPDKTEALKVVGKALALQRAQLSGRKVRLPTAVDGGVRRIIHVQSAKSPELNELQVLDNVRKASAGLGLTPAWARISEDGFRISLLTVTKEMKMSSKGVQGHRIYGEGDVIFPGAHLTLSSTVMANRVVSFFYVQACENGSLFGEECGYDLSIQRNNGIIQAIPAVLSALFKLTLERAPQTKKVLEDIREESFNDVPLIESYAKAASITRAYDQFLKEPLETLQFEASNRLQAFQLITEAAHKSELQPEVQIRLEELAGRYAYAGKAKVKPSNN